MDPDSGRFAPVTEATPADWRRFTVGEEVEVKGIPMLIDRINSDRIVLRPVVQVKNPYGDNRHARRRYEAELRHQR